MPVRSRSLGVCVCPQLSVSKERKSSIPQIIPPSPPQCESPFCSWETGKVSGGILAWGAYPASNCCANLSSTLSLIMLNIVSIWIPQIIHWVEQSAGSVTHLSTRSKDRVEEGRKEERPGLIPWSEWEQLSLAFLTRLAFVSCFIWWRDMKCTNLVFVMNFTKVYTQATTPRSRWGTLDGFSCSFSVNYTILYSPE